MSPFPTAVCLGAGAGEVSGWEIKERRGGVSHVAARCGVAPVAAVLSPTATCPSFSPVASSLLPARLSEGGLEKPLSAALRMMVLGRRLRRQRGEYRNGESPGRDVGGARSSLPMPFHHEAGKVCPGLGARRENPSVPRPLSDLPVSAFRNNRRGRKLGSRPNGKRGTIQEGVPSGRRNSTAAPLFSLTSSCLLISYRQ